jgi:hypothetical protein
MKQWIAALAALVALAALAEPAAAERFKATLTGDQEVPPVVTDAVGEFAVVFNKALTEGRFTLIVRRLDGVNRAHLHCALAGTNGPIFIHLMGDMHTLPASIDVHGRWLDHATLTDASISNTATPCGATVAEVVEAIRAGMVYVNVHTVSNAGGEIRGQLE